MAMLGHCPGDIDPTTGLLVSVRNLWTDPASETPAVGTCELWEIHNFTVDAHPVHLHLVQFEIIGRYPDAAGQPDLAGLAMNPPEANELGRKDMVICYPGEVTVIKAVFDKAGNYVWHCHILDHEDNEMMRPMIVQ